MDTPHVLALATAGALLVTKALDCATTLWRVRTYADETNPWVRGWMKRFGVRRTVIAVFLLTAIVVAASAWPIFAGAGRAYAVLFVVLGAVVAVVQADVAMSNATGRRGPISRAVARFYARQGRE